MRNHLIINAITAQRWKGGITNDKIYFSEKVQEKVLTQLLRFILVFLANQRFVFLICFTVFYKF